MTMARDRSQAGFPTCPRCGAQMYSRNSLYCTHCGAPGQSVLDWRAGEHFGDLFWGSAMVICGLALYLWARPHSPHMGLGEMLVALGMDPNAYYIREPLYSLIVVAAAALGLGGCVLLIRALIEQAKK